MEEKSVPSSAPPSTPSAPVASPPAEPTHEEPWRPRMDSPGVFHSFQNETPEADSILESPQLRDPEKDTAPLQGSKDKSDEDSLEDIE
jgi:hypothetical protein